MALFSRLSPERVRAAVKLQRATPELRLHDLLPGVDNTRHDVHLSPAFIRFTRPYILKLFVKHSAAGELLEQKPAPPAQQDRSEFKRLLQEVLLAAIGQAKTAEIIDIDLLANVAVFKYLGWEAQQQYARVVQDAKNKLKLYEGPKHERNLRAFQLKEDFAQFQTDKKNILRRVTSELSLLANEVQADAVRKMRESLFGGEAGQWFPYFSNPLAVTENGQDDYIHLDKYVLFGHFHRDPDLYEAVERWLKSMLRWLDGGSAEARELEARVQATAQLAAAAEFLRQQLGSPERTGRLGRFFGGRPEPAEAPISPELAARMEQAALSEGQLRLLEQAYDGRLDEMLNEPDNAEELFGWAHSEQLLAEARARQAPREELAALEEKPEIQRFLIEEFHDSAQQLGLPACVAAAYETAAIYQDYCPPIHPQQLKHALLDPAERKKVEGLIAHYKLTHGTEAKLGEAAARMRGGTPRDSRALLVRFIRDFLRHHRDASRLAAFQAQMDRVNLAFDEKNRELSRINNTLYEFLLAEERKPRDERVGGHVILKADVRDSTRMTAELFARGLNPASHFSLNLFQPLNKLLPRYGAEKVFIEGDAIILAMFQKPDTPAGGYPMARACGLAREIMEIVAHFNARQESSELPRLDVGIGICWQDSLPMYLLDGDSRIMISSAINLADRLSGCSKLARRALARQQTLFNVFVCQTIPEEAAAGAMEEFLVRYNTGVCLSEEAFAKLAGEISLKRLEVRTPMLWGPESVVLHSGSFPLSLDVFQKLVIREAPIAFVNAESFALKEPTARKYYEVCTNRKVYEMVDQMMGAAAHA
jgi:class 3 adenylate cyclase